MHKEIRRTIYDKNLDYDIETEKTAVDVVKTAVGRSTIRHSITRLKLDESVEPVCSRARSTIRFLIAILKPKKLP